MIKETLDKLKKDFNKKDVIARGRVKGFDGNDIILTGYKWQSYVRRLNEDLEVNWDFKIISYENYGTEYMVMGRLTIENVVHEQPGIAGIDEKGLKVAIKSAVDDCLARCCALFGLGMKAYLGKEDRISDSVKHEGEYKKQLSLLMEKRKLDDRKLQEKLLENGYQHELPTQEENFDDTRKLIDVSNFTEEQAKSILNFLNEISCTFLLKKLQKETKERLDIDFEPEQGDFVGCNTAIKKFGMDIIKVAIEDFLGWATAKTAITNQASPMHKWASIMKAANQVIERRGVITEKNKKKKKKIGKIIGVTDQANRENHGYGDTTSYGR